MRSRSCLLLWPWLLGLAPAMAQQPDALDPAFGTGGLVATSFGTFTRCEKLLVDASGAYYAAGSISDGQDHSRFGLAKYLSDGTLDADFGTGGLATMAVGAGLNNCQHAVLEPNGKILLGGVATMNGIDYFMVARFRPDGVADSTFGGAGAAVWDLSPSDISHSTGMAVQPDSKILLSGILSAAEFAVVRFNADGTHDTGFAEQGLHYQYVGIANYNGYGGLLRLPDGKVMLVGAGQLGGAQSIFLQRLTPEGFPDEDFGPSGIVAHAISESTAGLAPILLPDGRIAITGFGLGPVSQDIFVARFLPSGELDPDFGTGGYSYTDHGTIEGGLALASMADGSLLVVSDATPDVGFALTHFSQDGQLDTDFGTDGRVTTLYTAGEPPEVRCLAVDAEQRVVLGGYVDLGGSWSLLLARYAPEATIGLPERKMSTLRAWPVPAAEAVHVALPAGPQEVELRDALGRMVQVQRHPGGATLRLDLDGLPAGPYVLCARGNDGIRTARLIKE